MKELTLITEKNELNHSYTVESCSIINSCTVGIVIKNEEIDDFLQEFLDKKTSHKLFINTDTISLRVKFRVICNNVVESDDEQTTAFSINLNILN